MKDTSKKLKKANKKLVNIVISRNIDVKTLAEAMGLANHNDLYNWRKKKKYYQFEKLEKIADALGLDINIVLK